MKPNIKTQFFSHVLNHKLKFSEIYNLITSTQFISYCFKIINSPYSNNKITSIFKGTLNFINSKNINNSVDKNIIEILLTIIISQILMIVFYDKPFLFTSNLHFSKSLELVTLTKIKINLNTIDKLFVTPPQPQNINKLLNIIESRVDDSKFIDLIEPLIKDLCKKIMSNKNFISWNQDYTFILYNILIIIYYTDQDKKINEMWKTKNFYILRHMNKFIFRLREGNISKINLMCEMLKLNKLKNEKWRNKKIFYRTLISLNKTETKRKLFTSLNILYSQLNSLGVCSQKNLSIPCFNLYSYNKKKIIFMYNDIIINLLSYNHLTENGKSTKLTVNKIILKSYKQLILTKQKGQRAVWRKTF